MTKQAATKTTDVPQIDFAAPADVQAVAVMDAAQPPAVVTEATTILHLIDRASRDPSVDMDKMERLMAMHERVLSKSAQAEFDNAMAEAQEAMRAISPDKDNSQTKSKYATYAALDQATRPIYSKHGFALSFNTGDAPNPNEVRVLCIVSHRGGHRQEYKIDMPADGKGPQGAAVMTRTHATGAAASYGQRYLLKLIFNLAVGDVDDDGNGASGDADIEGLAPANARRNADGKLLSNYDSGKAQKAQDDADNVIQLLNTLNADQAREWARENSLVPKGYRKSFLQGLKDRSPGQHMRVRQTYQNVTGEDLE